MGAVRLSVVIPVFRESALINETVEHIAAHVDRDIEVIVADGAPGSDTIAAVEDERVVKVSSAPGRGVQMNAGAAVARGDVLVFVHADTVLPAGWTSMVTDVIDGGADAGAFDLGIDAVGIGFRIIEKTANIRSRLTKTPYGDQVQFFTRGMFDRVGGYPAWPIMEDVEIMRRARRNGGVVRFASGRVLTSARRWKKEGMVRCTIRNWMLILLYLLGVSPERLAGYYRSAR